MSSGKNYFPVDIFAVKEYGIKKWQDEFFWPVSDKEFVNIACDIEQCLRRYTEAQTGEMSDLLLILCGLRPDYWHFLHALKVVNKLEEAGKDAAYSKSSLWYGDIIAGCPEAASVSKRKIRHGLAQRLKFAAANLFRNIGYNFKFKNIKEKKEIVEVYRSVTPPIKQYIMKSPHRFHFTSELDWIPKIASYEVTGNLTDKIGQISRAIANELGIIAQKNGIKPLSRHVAYLGKRTEDALINAAKTLNLIKGKVGENKFKLLASGFGDFFSRALYVTIRRQGGEVMSFSHGGNIGLYNTPSLAFSEFALSDEFITYTHKSAGLFEKIKNNHPPIRNNRVNIKSCDSNQFLKTWQKYGNRPLPKKIKKVMYIGYPHNQWRKHQAAGGLSLIHLDLELRIVDILAKSGYDIFYKAHPDRISEVKGIFENKTKVLGGYFQNYLDMADAFLFGSIRTTAFSIALCTNKPIIGFIMNDEPYKPFSEAMELLEKRCGFIHAKFDERNRMVFDKEELLTALSQKPTQPNTEFIETYMFPEVIVKRKVRL